MDTSSTGMVTRLIILVDPGALAASITLTLTPLHELNPCDVRSHARRYGHVRSIKRTTGSA